MDSILCGIDCGERLQEISQLSQALVTGIHADKLDCFGSQVKCETTVISVRNSKNMCSCVIHSMSTQLVM